MKKPIKILATVLATLTAVPVLANQVEINKAAIARNSTTIKSNSESIQYLQDILFDIPSKIAKPMFLKICKGSDAIHWGTCPLNLLGTEIDLKIIYQPSSSSTIKTLTHPATASIVEPGIEFPRTLDLDIIGDGIPMINVSINVGNDFIEIDFSNASDGKFWSAVENTFVFRLNDIESDKITSATIDSSVTTLELENSDVRFVGNELFINVENLSFNSSTFVRVNLGI
ncbi:hypothetical protein BMR02_13860 [Methylococcaceae bacterium HT1]|nr:hypothetical protein BMR02_13860 [Methylococcaceae bacterium HT1]